MSGNIDHSSRAHALLSASSAHRWLACPPSALASTAYTQEDTVYTREGTLAHEIAEIIASGMRRPEEVETGADITPEMVQHAVAYADYISELKTVDNAIVLLEQRVDFSAWVPEGFGTADCVVIQGNRMDVIDYKFGAGVPVYAQDNPQELLYGLGALDAYGFAYDIEVVRLHIFQPRLDNISVFELTAADMLAWGERIKPIAALAAAGKGEYKPGAHCKFCPHAGRCRALTKLCTETINHHGLRRKLPILAPHEIAEVLQLEPLVTLWLKRVKDYALRSMLDGETVPGYKLVEGKQGNRKWTDELRVAGALETAGYAREDITVTTLLTPAAMDKVIGKKRVSELLSGLIERTPGAPTIAPETDKRPAYDQKSEIARALEAE